jgi:SOS-response transcriptional repressor LexA
VRVTLRPTNSDYQPIELTSDDEDSVQVIAEVVEVFG